MVRSIAILIYFKHSADKNKHGTFYQQSDIQSEMIEAIKPVNDLIPKLSFRLYFIYDSPEY